MAGQSADSPYATGPGGAPGTGRRRRRTRRVGSASPQSVTADLTAEVVTTPVVADPVAPAEAEGGLRGLIGGGSTQVSPAMAMRARDAARPRAEDLQAAETDLVIVRRRWSAPSGDPPVRPR